MLNVECSWRFRGNRGDGILQNPGCTRKALQFALTLEPLRPILDAMNDPIRPPPLPYSGPRPPEPTGGSKFKKLLAPLGVVGVLLLKLKAFILPVLKFFP